MKKIIKLDDDDVKLIEKKMAIVADARYNEMQRRGHNTTKEQNRQQWMDGAKAERAVQIYLKQCYNVNTTDPDLELRTDLERTHDADLKILFNNGTVDVSVKCDRTVPYSWAFDKRQTDSILVEEFLYKDSVIALVHKISYNQFEVIGIFSTLKLAQEKMFARSVKLFTKPKSCLYLKDRRFDDGTMAKGVERLLQINYDKVS